MTRQEAFDTAARAMLAQGRPGQEPEEGGQSCAYFASDGSRCSIGWLVPEDVAREMEGSGDGEIDSISLQLVPVWMAEDMHFCVKLQAAHDNATRRAACGDAPWLPLFIAGMRKVARHFNLSAAVLEEPSV